MMHLATYKRAAYASFIHIPCVLVRKVNVFIIDIEFVKAFLSIFMAVKFLGLKYFANLELLEFNSRQNPLEPLRDSLCAP